MGKQVNVHKTFLKTWVIQGFYQYRIYEINAGGETWLQADNEYKGLVSRSAENEQVLRILLENDCRNFTKWHKQYVR